MGVIVASYFLGKGMIILNCSFVLLLSVFGEAVSSPPGCPGKYQLPASLPYREGQAFIDVLQPERPAGTPTSGVSIWVAVKELNLSHHNMDHSKYYGLGIMVP